MKQLIIAALAIAISGTARAQTEVTPYKPGITAEGITYFLPTTGLHVTLTATRTIYTPGEYSRYAERYLRLHDVPQEEYEEWQLTAINVTPYGTADASQSYTIKLKSKTSAPLVSLAADGCLLAVNTDDPPTPAELSSPSVTRHTKTGPNPADYKTEEILAAGSPAKMAELTAAEIYDIRENRTLLTKGQADFMPKDGEQLRIMLQQLDTQEEALLQLFKGTTETETHVLTLDYLPTAAEADGTSNLLFRFSKHLGLVDNDDLAGEPYTITVTDLHALPAEATDSESGNRPSKEPEDLRYRVPGKASIRITDPRQNDLYTATFPLAQLGRVEHLGGELFNKRNTTRVYLSPETGGITKIEADQP